MNFCAPMVSVLIDLLNNWPHRWLSLSGVQLFQQQQLMGPRDLRRSRSGCGTKRSAPNSPAVARSWPLATHEKLGDWEVYLQNEVSSPT